MKFYKFIKPNKLLFIFLLIIISSSLRVLWVDAVPPGLNRDEAAIGYTAYSILKTGRDEFGRFLPLSLESFGDWKLPLYVYFTVPSIFFFGLTEFSVRLVSILCGVGTVVLTYFLTLRFMKDKKTAYLAAIIIAISPWHIFFSRVASEANLAVFLTTLAVLLLTYVRHRPQLLILVSSLFVLTLESYHRNHIFTPFLFIGLLINYRKEFFSRPWGPVSIAIFAVCAGIIFSQTLFSADKTKISGLLAVNDISVVHENIVKNRLIFHSPFLGKVFNNKILFSVENILQNYARTFSPEFLFIKGGGNAQHNIPLSGNLYLIEAPFFILGLFFLFHKKEPSAPLFLFWILISSIGAALTKDAPHSARQFAIFPILPIIIAYGIRQVIILIPNRPVRKIAAASLTLGFVVSLGVFISRYFVIFPYRSYQVWGGPYKEMAIKLNNKKTDTHIITARPDYSMYIYYLFYNRVDPKLVQTSLKRYPPTDEGFVHAHSFQNLTFRKIDWADDLLRPNNLYVDWVETVPYGATHSAVLITSALLKDLDTRGIVIPQITVGAVVKSELIDEVKLPDNTPYMYFIKTSIDTMSPNQLNKQSL